MTEQFTWCWVDEAGNLKHIGARLPEGTPSEGLSRFYADPNTLKGSGKMTIPPPPAANDSPPPTTKEDEVSTRGTKRNEDPSS